MRRWVPDSIAGWTVTVLLAGLLASQLATVAVFALSRMDFMAALATRNIAERIASVAQLMEETPADQRLVALRALDVPGLRGRWGKAAWVEENVPGERADTLAAALRERLDGRTVRVDLGGEHHHMDAEPPALHVPPPPPLARIERMGPFGRLARVSVRLNDGSWLNLVAALDGGAESIMRTRFAFGFLASVLVVAVMAVWAIRRAARPFTRFAAAAERLGVDVDAPPLTERGPLEVRRAAHAFNTMQTRLRRYIEDRTQMLAAISHDLRTPITRMRLRAEFIDDDGERDKMLADLAEMEQMIAATLAFARDDATREARRPMNLAALLQGLVDDATAGGAAATYHGPESLVIQARPSSLKRAFANLVDNAVKYAGGVEVGLRVAPDGGLLVTVDDRGPGLPEEELERVFAPFYRVERSRNRETGGTGLGLSVVRNVTRAHGGDVVLANRSGGGLRASLSLPSNGGHDAENGTR